MIYTSSFSSWRRSPLKRRPTVDFVARPGKQRRVKEIRETLVHTVDAGIKRGLQTQLTETEQFIQPPTPICRPHDILTELAYVFSTVQNNGAWSFSAVCRTWRAAALCNPRAWTDIHLIAAKANPNSPNEFYGQPVSQHPVHQLPDAVLCISRAGVLPLSLEFHGLTTTTSDMANFLSKVIPHVERLCFHKCGGRFLLGSQPIPKLKELVVVPEEEHTLSAYNETAGMFSGALSKIFGTNDLATCTRALNRLWVARFHKINWDEEYFTGFRQLRDLTLQDCTCGPDDNIHQFLQANCGTLEHLHLSLTVSGDVQDRPLPCIHFPRLRTFSFNVARREQNSYRSNQSSPFIIHSYHVVLFQSLIAPKATELQVYAPYIEDLDFGVHYPSLQHLHVIIPATMDDVFPCVISLKSLIHSSPLRTLHLFISTNHYKLPEREYGIAAMLTSLLCDPLVLYHATFTVVNIKLRPDFEPVWEQVSYHWMRRGKSLRIQGATNSECIEDGFFIIHYPRPVPDDISE